jgi:hypothetical protein
MERSASHPFVKQTNNRTECPDSPTRWRIRDTNMLSLFSSSHDTYLPKGKRLIDPRFVNKQFSPRLLATVFFPEGNPCVAPAEEFFSPRQPRRKKLYDSLLHCLFHIKTFKSSNLDVIFNRYSKGVKKENEKKDTRYVHLYSVDGFCYSTS